MSYFLEGSGVGVLEVPKSAWTVSTRENPGGPESCRRSHRGRSGKEVAGVMRNLRSTWLDGENVGNVLEIMGI